MDIYSSISNLKGVGPKTCSKLEKCMIFNIIDLLLYFPRDYEYINYYSEDNSCKKSILKVKVESIKKDIRTKTGKILTNIIFKDCDDNNITGTYFNQPYMKNFFKIGNEYLVQGSLKEYKGNITITNAKIVKDNMENLKEKKIIPKYHLTKDLKNSLFIKLIGDVLDNIKIEENLPKWILEKYKLCSLQEAVFSIHNPKSDEKLKSAIRRLKFEELLTYCLKINLIKNYLKKKSLGIAFNISDDVEKLKNTLPYNLTKAQEKVLNEILQDQVKNNPMNRLVQGDVGSGKTIVSLISLFNVIKNGYQTLLIAPTEILATQHYEEALKLFKNFNVTVELLVGSTKKLKKIEIKDKLRQQQIDLVIGTHALIEEDVEFKRLGMIVTDEQHRFGVMQRSKLLNKGSNVDTLVMSATPIPRTLTLSIYGDLEISIIDEMPPGRQKIDTYYVTQSYRQRVYNFALKEIKKGRQVYIVCPLVEEKQESDLNSVEKLYKSLKEEYFNDICISILHGKMKGKEKESIMEEFKNGNIKALISTTVIEVGVNVPNASLMIIENSERFGLAQLHQLRGRVGRGEFKSYCVLIPNIKNQIIKKRMDIMKNSNDGFFIAEQDLKLRGAGEIFGFKQHGSNELLLADVVNDINILKVASKEAKVILESLKKEDIKLVKEMKNKIQNNSKYICFN